MTKRCRCCCQCLFDLYVCYDNRQGNCLVSGAWQAIIGQPPSPWPRLYLHMTSHVIVDVRWVASITFNVFHSLPKLLTKSPFIYNTFFQPDLTNSIYLQHTHFATYPVSFPCFQVSIIFCKNPSVINYHLRTVT